MKASRRVHAPWIVAIACALAACASPTLTTVQPPPVSTPFVVAPAASIVTAEQDVYVSLPPDSIPAGVTATITNRRTSASATAAIVAGGFDPVAIAAVAGDSITISVQTTTSPLSFAYAVPVVTPPVVVRTDPAPHKRDVPLNASLVMVFNQPMDATTLTAANVQLLSGGRVVPGVLTFSDAQHIMGTFQPTAPLAANTDYQLAVGSGVHDTHGDPLAAPVSVAFTTGQGTTTDAAVATVTLSPTAVSLVTRGTIQFTATTKDSAGNVLAGRTVAWSSDDAAVATVTTDGLVTGLAGGTATISGTSDGVTGTASVVVFGAPPSGAPGASRTFPLRTPLPTPLLRR